ncbi:uncharacterized protein Z520_00200 [Fonsecaea multimorphosa CBS 102226]|uniref:Histidine kinase n=1 Tax=Fonsecaea multimorphosa CBS 102226 TaxID=1442371 RepID=A0A0D2L378_9EURO|nr:uncharacterized protein Z520_00200 [Fonsecaea multimorphosa CBS 102226]KIY03509.1 hypothetical protein Z520_00200 [Fonsecaea multimorphosa CBS 102226]OAL32625.1 hypothetical protein AYO22_00238 [Fonsecaea multimorphosa]
MAPEAAREREMHRYYQPWLETFLSTDFEPASDFPPSNDQAQPHRPRSSRDKALTAFAQLGCLRLNAKRCIVTLLGTTRQYIIAEATKSLSLLSDAHHDDGDELWFGNSFIEREGGISADAMYPDEYTASDPDGSSFTTPALVVSDISTHEKYKTRGYAGRGVSFYCGVPITTQMGHVIGVYNVTDDKPRQSLSATELHFLLDMSVIVIQHLEGVRNDRARMRGERLIYGIGTFIEGDKAEAAPGDGSKSQGDKSNDSKTSQNGASESTKTAEFRGLVIGDANAPVEDSNRKGARDRANGRKKATSSGITQESILNYVSSHTQAPPPAKTPKDKILQESRQVFDRAAAVLQYCLRATGVAFLNASSANLSSGSSMKTSGAAVSEFHHAKSKGRGHSDHQNGMQGSDLQDGGARDDSTASSDDAASTRSNSDSSASQGKRQVCEILGIRTVDAHQSISLADPTMRRLVRRHPKGKCFSFDQFGRPASSDDSSESASAAEISQGDGDQPAKVGHHVPTTNSLLKALPGARKIVFLPLWDFAKERWHSGLVVWSNDAGSLTNVEDDMVYLKAFSNAVVNELNRIDLALSDTAKSTFLANISHELRSPLHGILGSIEFLHDTAMDDFQSSMVISVETCGKTLLDTVNHVLDYAKIHSLSKSHRQDPASAQDRTQRNKSETNLTEDFDMAVVVEEAVEAVYAGQVFRTANADALEGKSPVQTAASRAMQQRLDRKANISKGSAKASSAVRLTLNIDDHTNWWVRSQPGAVRRIVMNILGNALKYTTKGSINVALEVDRSRNKSSSNLHMLLKIADTGRGMSDDFMKNHAFTAFSQEDTLATGTGLGLSIVRQIVDSLRGKIDLSSEKDVGTEVRIWLRLPRSEKDVSSFPEAHVITDMRQRISGREMCMLLPYDEKNNETDVRYLVPMPTIESSMRNLVSQWFRMKITTTKTMDGISPDFFIYPEPPPIDYLMDYHGKPETEKEVPVIILCTNAFEAASLRSNGIHYLTDIGRVIEVIAQPCGPQKLAKVLNRCMQRLELLQKDHTKKPSKTAALSFFRGRHSDKESIRATENTPGKGEEPVQDGGLGSMPDGDNAAKPESHETSREPPNETQSRPQKPSLTKMGTSDGAVTLTESDGTKSAALPREPDTNNPRVLVVDDNHINLHLLVTFVRKAGHPFESATDGLKALEAYKKSVREDGGRNAFKHIFMDISMPVMNGIASAKEIRQFEKDNKVDPPAKIIALTGMGSDVAHNEAINAGFDQFLSKPIVSLP